MTSTPEAMAFENEINLKMMTSGLPPPMMIGVALRLAASTIVACTMRECSAGGPLDDAKIISTGKGMSAILYREIEDCAARFNVLARAALLVPDGPKPQ